MVFVLFRKEKDDGNGKGSSEGFSFFPLVMERVDADNRFIATKSLGNCLELRLTARVGLLLLLLLLLLLVLARFLAVAVVVVCVCVVVVVVSVIVVVLVME